MGDLFHAISQLGTFDHHACDAALRAANMKTINFNLHKGSGDSTIYVQSAFTAVWLAGVTIMMFGTWFGSEGVFWGRFPKSRYVDRRFARAATTGLFLYGLLIVALQANTVIDYVDTCRAVLHAG